MGTDENKTDIPLTLIILSKNNEILVSKKENAKINVVYASYEFDTKSVMENILEKDVGAISAEIEFAGQKLVLNEINHLKFGIVFQTLWDNYPRYSLVHLNNNGKDKYGNHCAINVSEALMKSGVNMTSFKENTCSSECDVGRKHARGAEALARWLKRGYFKDANKVIELNGKDYKEKIDNKKGIIFFKDYWQRKDEKGTEKRTGDHIDLWDEGTLAGSGELQSFLRQSFPLFVEDVSGFLHDNLGTNTITSLSRSKKVLFWEMR